MDGKIKVTLVRSGIGRNRKTRQVLRGLGLTKLNKTVILNNTTAIRGMVEKVSFMVKVSGANAPLIQMTGYIIEPKAAQYKPLTACAMNRQGNYLLDSG